MRVLTFFKVRPDQEVVYIKTGEETCLCSRLDANAMGRFSTMTIKKVIAPQDAADFFTLVVE